MEKYNIKSKEELNTIKEKTKTLSKGIYALSYDELEYVNGGVSTNEMNWTVFGSAIIVNGGEAIPVLEEMVSAIKLKDWVHVSILVNKPEIAALPIVVSALENARTC